MLKKLALSLLALAALGSVALAIHHAWIHWWLDERLRRLESADRDEFSRAYAELAYDPDSRLSLLLCDRLEDRPSRALRYQIVRVLHTRIGVHYAPEEAALPSNEEMRRMVKERYAGRGPAQREKP